MLKRVLILCVCLCAFLGSFPALATDNPEHILKLPTAPGNQAAPMVEDNEIAPEVPAEPSSASAKPADAKPAAAPAIEYNTIVLQGLNKVTAHISRLEATLGNVMRFGNLEIIARRCWKSAPEDQPENAALLEIWELRPGESPQRIFLGWMFSSSPGLSGLEHPVYDVTVLGCEAKVEPEQAKEVAPADAKIKPATGSK